MGLNMKFLLIVWIFLVSNSCMKKTTFDETKGEETQSVNVQKSLLTAWGKDTPNSIQTNDFVYIEREQQVQDYNPILIFQQGVSVITKVEASDSYLYTMAFQSNEITNGNSKVSTDEYKISVPKNSALSMDQKNLNSASLKSFSDVRTFSDYKYISVLIFQNFLYSACKSTDKVKATCYNLKITDEKIPAPDLVAQQPNCLNLQDCKINYKTISFDQIYEYTDTSQGPESGTVVKEKINYQLFFSPDVPYLARLMGYCYKGLIKIPSNGQKVLVKICEKVKNFQFGAAPVPSVQAPKN